MSINVQHGYRIDLAAAGGLFGLTEQARAALTATHRRLYAHHVAASATLLWDLARLGELPGATRIDRSAVAAAHRELTEAHERIEATGRREPALDLQCELVLLGDPDDPLGSAYALLYTEQGTYHETFAALPGVTAWGYQSATDDRPAGVAAADWARRRDTWARVIGPSGVPAHRGLAWQVLDKAAYAVLRPQDLRAQITAAIPDHAQRLAALAAAVTAPCTLIGDGQIRWHEPDQVRADRRAAVDRLRDHIEPVTVEQLFTTRLLELTVPAGP